jgi:hypothetical protein
MRLLALAATAQFVKLLLTQHAVWRVVEGEAEAIVLVVAVGATATSAVDREHQLDNRGSTLRPTGGSPAASLTGTASDTDQ